MGEFASTTAVENNVAALPRVDSAYLGLDDIFGANGLIQYEETRNFLRNMSPYYLEKDWLRILELTDRVDRIYTDQYRNYEAGPMFRPAYLATVTAVAGNTHLADVTLTAGSYTNVPQITGGVTGTSQNRSGLMRTDLIKMKDQVQVWVEEKGRTGTSGTATIYRLQGPAGSDIVATLNSHRTGGHALMVISNAWGEGTLEPTEGLEQTTSWYSNRVQIIKTWRSITGTANAVKINDRSGRERYYYKQEFEMGGEHRIREKLGVWHGTGDSYVDPAENNVAVHTTMGVDAAIRAMGNVFEYTKSAHFTAADLNAIVAQINAMHGGSEYLFPMGFQLFLDFQTVVAGLVQNAGGLVNYAAFGNGDAKKKAVDLEFLSVNVAGITFHAINSDLMNIPEITNLEGYNNAFGGYLIPGNKQAIASDADGGIKRMMVNALSLVYMTDEENNMRRYVYTKRGVKETRRDQKEQSLLTHGGARIVEVRKWIVIDAV